MEFGCVINRGKFLTVCLDYSTHRLSKKIIEYLRSLNYVHRTKANRGYMQLHIPKGLIEELSLNSFVTLHWQPLKRFVFA